MEKSKKRTDLPVFLIEFFGNGGLFVHLDARASLPGATRNCERRMRREGSENWGRVRGNKENWWIALWCLFWHSIPSADEKPETDDQIFPLNTTCLPSLRRGILILEILFMPAVVVPAKAPLLWSSARCGSHLNSTLCEVITQVKLRGDVAFMQNTVFGISCFSSIKFEMIEWKLIRFRLGIIGWNLLLLFSELKFQRS